jgi:hypothetical protein
MVAGLSSVFFIFSILFFPSGVIVVSKEAMFYHGMIMRIGSLPFGLQRVLYDLVRKNLLNWRNR